MFRITVTEIPFDAAKDEIGIKRYEQVVDELDIRAVMQAVNQKKRGPRAAPKAKP